MTDITERLTERELQELRNTGNESERAADEIERLRAEVADLRAECVGLRVNEQNLRAEVESLRADAQAMLPQMIAALAAIDAALGIPDDGCNSTGQTLTEIRRLRAAAAQAKSGPADNQAAVEVLLADLKKLSHYAPATMREDLYRQAITAALAAERERAMEHAAQWVQDRRDAFCADHGHIDPDTGALEFGRGQHADAKSEYVGELEEIFCGIRALKAKDAP